ncbi:MAG: hypothetical protein FJ284_04855 [Planctomycetes bacterium]|nr:hypothetical protein [Planctomycetota bacterium]
MNYNQGVASHDRPAAAIHALPFALDMTAFLSGISVVCFAASYAVALGCEASRLLFRSGIRGIVMVGFAAAGLIAHALYLGWRAAGTSAVPFSSPADLYLLVAWLLAAGYLWMTLANPRTPVGLFLLPIVLALVGVATFAPDAPSPLLHDATSRFWGWFHGSLHLAWTVAVVLGAVAGLMWLIQAGRLARKEPPIRGFRMPSLERLGTLMHRGLAVAAWAGAAAFVSGIILNAIQGRGGAAPAVPWSDSVIARMALMVAWLVVANGVALTVRRRPGGDRLAAWLSLASLAVLTGWIAWGLVIPSGHGAAAPAAQVVVEEAS